MGDRPVDPRIVHVASELDVDLGPEAENDGNLEYVTWVIESVDYANEQCDLTHDAALRKAVAAVLTVNERYAGHDPFTCTDSDHGCGRVRENIIAIQQLAVEGDKHEAHRT